MIIQIIIFITINKLFACEIDNDGRTDGISIKGNPDIKCDDATDVDELLECLFDAFSIDSFADDNFDIVIVDCGGDKKIVSYLNVKCADAAKLSIISIEKLLPLLTWNKKQLASGEEIVVAFADACYKVACDEKLVVRFTGRSRKGKENITLELDDFGCLYYFNVENMQGGVVNTTDLQEKDNVIAKLEEENEKLVHALNEKEKALTVALTTTKDAEQKIAELNAKMAQWEKDHPKPSNLVEQMVKIVEECKNEVADYTDGYFYTKGKIPKQKLDLVIEEFTKKFGVKIERKNIVALYIHYPENYPSFGALQKILICQDYLCVENCRLDPMNRKELLTEPIYWKNLMDVTESSGDSFRMYFHFYSGATFCTTMEKNYARKNSNNNLLQKLVPALNKINELINMREVE